MRILVIRHGESEADLLNVHEGRADFELTKQGHRQAEAMGKWVADKYHISRIYCSPLKRACQTAKHLAQYCDKPLIVEDKLMEFNNGLIAGLGRKEADLRYPEVHDLAVHEAVYEQESKLEFRFRADYILSKIIKENQPEDTIVIVTHGGMIVQLYRSLLRLPVDSEAVFVTGDTGIHEWLIEEHRRVVIRSNDTRHLMKE